MSAQQVRPGSLSRAQDRIQSLLDELNATVEAAETLTRSGQAEEALAMVERQRASLFRTVDEISHDVSVREKRGVIRRYAPALIAAAMLSLSGLAASVAVIHSNDGLGHAKTQLAAAQQIQDPVIRLREIIRVYRETRLLPQKVIVRSTINQDLASALNKTKDDLQKTPQNKDLVNKAERWADDAQHGRAPSPPDSSDKSPLQRIKDIIKS